VANASSNTVSVRLGDGAGGFTAAPNVAVGSSPRSVAVGDFTGDDRPDLAVANANRNSTIVSVRLNQDTTAPASPTCRIRATVAGPPKQIVVGAFDLGSGIRAIQVTTLVNATVRIEPFASMGRFSPEVKAVVTKVDQTKGSQVAFVVTDGDGNQASCF
jgi:hypothetical protein